MKALINNPKRTGIICFITLILTMVADIVCQYDIYSTSLAGKFYISSILVKSFITGRFTFLLTRQILFGRLFLILYLGFVLFKKNKNMKALNIIAIIQLVIFGFNELKQIIDVINYEGNILASISSYWGMYFYFMTMVIMIYLMTNIVLKKKINYALWSAVGGIMIAIILLVNIVNIQPITSYVIYDILESISYLTILIFIYSYGKSISKRSGINE